MALGTGKSTVAAGIFYELKCMKKNVELVTEYAKELVYDDRKNILKRDQLYIFAKQNRKIRRLIAQRKLDIIVSDCPTLLSIIYNHESDSPEDESFDKFVLNTFNKYNNLNILLNRNFEYDTLGRYQTLEESKQIDKNIKKLLDDNKIDYIEYNPYTENIKSFINRIL